MHTDVFVSCVPIVDRLLGFSGPLVARGADALTTEWTVSQDPKNEVRSFHTRVCSF